MNKLTNLMALHWQHARMSVDIERARDVMVRINSAVMAATSCGFIIAGAFDINDRDVSDVALWRAIERAESSVAYAQNAVKAGASCSEPEWWARDGVWDVLGR